MKERPCPCTSGDSYDQCCLRYHLGIPAENALRLMRSRYSAYALKLPDYIMKTTHPLNAQYMQDQKAWRAKILEFSEMTVFQKLEILNFAERDDTAVVLFIAYIKQKGRDATFTEKSNFEKLNGLWLYLDGKVYKGALC